MALIIKGDMPKACNWFDENGKHRFCKVNAFCDCRTYTRGKRPSDCPIIGEIPDKHGDLIDEDEFRQVFYDEMRKYRGNEPVILLLKELLAKMDNAHVMLEASNE